MDIPTPPSNGSSGSQRLDESQPTNLTPYTPLAGLPLAKRVEGIAANRPRILGGEVAATLIAGSFTQMSEELSIQRDLALHANERTSKLQEDLGICKTEVAVLRARLRATESTQTIKQIAIFAGTALLAVAIDLLKAELRALAAIVFLLGGALLAFSAFTSRGSESK